MKIADRVMLAVYFLLDIGYAYAFFSGYGTNILSNIFVGATVTVTARMLFLLWKKQKQQGKHTL